MKTNLEIFISNWMPQGNHDYQQDYFIKDLNNAIDEIKAKCADVYFTCGDCHSVKEKINAIDFKILNYEN